ncbi:hypothetical protein [Ammonifex degensii]|uniref:hypothetical protein n=1 Tax=Ammonifex degensii TaxID=42838 RepID=UPI001B7FE199|nr:hypothetical protein [Ammonifex degensii]
MIVTQSPGLIDMAYVSLMQSPPSCTVLSGLTFGTQSALLVVSAKALPAKVKTRQISSTESRFIISNKRLILS